MTPEQQKIADKILRLLAVAASTTFAAEADTARKLAEQLIAQHNIRLAPGKPSQDTIECREFKPAFNGARWEGVLIEALTMLCSCRMFFNHEKLDHYSLVGTIWNLDCLEYMLRETNRQRQRAWLNYKSSGGGDKFYQFCYGYAKALASKVDKIIKPSYWGITYQLVTWYEENILKQPVEPFNLAMGAFPHQTTPRQFHRTSASPAGLYDPFL
jgi:hypothetical protein